MIHLNGVPEVQAVWGRLERFQLDDDNAVFDFSARLAKENGWTRSYTARAIQEYKRFLLLAKFAGHPVTPSEAVDQVWHLHLVYTRSYWQVLCGEILKQPLHHHPTAGGLDEDAKFRGQYQQTLDSYRRLFGEDPPADVWPPVDEAFQPKALRWVDASRHWLVPRPAWIKALTWRRLLAPATGVLALFVLAGCDPNVLTWRGPEFLKFYGWAFGAAFALSLVLVALKRGPKPAATPPLLTDRYDIAFLGAGGRRVMDAVLTVLYGKDLMNIDSKQQCQSIVTRDEAAAANLHDLEAEVWRALPSHPAAPLRAVRKTLAPALTALHERLAAAGLVYTKGAYAFLQFLAALPFLVLMAIGALKICVGMNLGRPVGFLIFFFFVTGFTLIVRLGCLRRRTPAGQALWRTLRRNRSRPKDRYTPNGRLISDPGDVALMVALTGYAATAGVPGYAGLHQALRSSGAEVSTGGCGSSGCGSGGGGGGCGGGGGGCGGCGGGGGCGS